MYQLKRVLAMALAFFVYNGIAAAQSPSAPSTLQLGVPVERTIASGQVQIFTINLEENKYVQLVADQRGIDVVVRVMAPGGKILAEVDSPNGDNGPEDVSFVASDAGLYRIAITPLDQDGVAKPGGYEIKVLEIRTATDEELKSDKNQEAVKARGITLLDDIERAIPSLRSQNSRIRFQLKLAQLLWTSDQKHATKVLADAVADFTDYSAANDSNNTDNVSFEANRQLRNEMLQALIATDPEMALNFLRSTRMQVAPNGSQVWRNNEDSMMEMSIATMLAQNNPKRSFEIAEETLKKRLSPELVGPLMRLRSVSPELGAKLAGDITERLLTEKLLTNSDATNLAVNILQMSRTVAAVRQGVPVSGRVLATPLLSEQDYRALFQKTLSEILSYKTPATNAYSQERNAVWNALQTIRSMGVDTDSIVPGSSTVIEKKFLELGANTDPQFAQRQKFQQIVSSGPIDAALEAAGQAPAEIRDQFYHQLAERAAASGDMTRAKQIVSENISDPYQRRDVLNNLEQQAIHQAVSKKKVVEALRIISTRRTAKERASLIAQIANQIGNGQKRATALNFLEQARSLLSPSEQAEDQEQMNALLVLSREFCRYDQKRAFNIVEPLVDQFNAMSAAARSLDGFGQQYFQDGELVLQNGNNVANVANQLSNTLAGLALIDFDHAKATTDRLQLTEVRIYVYLEIAQQTIQQNKVNPNLFTQRRILE